jgi:hypothetical protein
MGLTIGNRFCKDCKWYSTKEKVPFLNHGQECLNIDKIGWSIEPELGFDKITGNQFKEKGKYYNCSFQRIWESEESCGKDGKFFELATGEDIIRRFFSISKFGIFIIIMGIIYNFMMWSN